MRLFIASPIILDDYASIKEDFKDIIEGKSPLESEVGIEEMGYFGRPPRVLFAKAEDKLLYNKAREFKEAGFDLYRFKPHITLCRIKTIHDYKAYKEKLKSYREKSLGLILPEINLYKSVLTAKGALHTKLT